MTPGGWILRQWRRRPGRALAAAAAVAVGVAAVVATWLAADAARAGYRRLAGALQGPVSVDVVARGGGRFASEQLPDLAAVPGVRAVVPQFFRPTVVRHGGLRIIESVAGVDVAGLADLGYLSLAEGVPCAGPREVVLDASLASGLAAAVGDRILILTRRGPRRVTVTGLTAPGGLAAFTAGAGVLMDIASLTDLSLATGQVDRVRVLVAPGADRDRVRAASGRLLPDELDARTPEGRAALADDVLRAADLGLDFVTGLTVAMAWFIVANAMLMAVSERRRSLSLARVLGATTRQVRRLVTGEAALLGCAGALVGAAVGIAAAAPIARRIAAALQAGDEPFAIQPGVVLVATALGPLVAVAAAWWPARQAAGVDLLESLAHAPPPPEPRVPWRFIAIAVALWTVAAALLGAVVVRVLPPRAAVPAGMIMLLAYVATTPLLLPTLVRCVSRLVPAAWRVEGRLAREQILRQPIRTALTTGVLVVAVSNGVGLGHAIRDNVDDMLAWYARSMQADWVLVRSGDAVVATEDALARLRAIPGVARVEAIAFAAGQVAGVPCVVVGRDLPADRPLPFRPVGADEATLRAALERGAAAAGSALASHRGVTDGATLTVEVRGRSMPVTIGGVVVDYTAGGAALHLRRDAARRLFGIENADFLLVTATPGQAVAIAGPLA
ncbi:MAG: ABC transporter permease [Planctomycetia bacterium]